MLLEKQEEKALKYFKETLTQQFGSEVVSIRLFGSKARGDSHAASDIDVLVVTQQGDWRLKEEIGKVATKILLDDGIYLSIKVIGQFLQQKLIDVGSPFIRNIQSEGIVL